MKRIVLLFIMIVLAGSTTLSAQDNLLLVSGQVLDNQSKQSLPGATVRVKNTTIGAVTDANGNFTLKTKLKFPFTLVFSSVGYAPQEFVVSTLNDRIKIELETQTILGQEVVVTASRIEESVMRSPVAIEKLDLKAIKETPAPSFFDALENVKGVQLTTSSITFKIPNTRGFNIPNNFRFVQLVDGIDMQAGTLGVSLGNTIGPSELDIETVEISPGASSALYGMNAINGMANMLTKSPFKYEGLSLYQKTGVNHVDGVDHKPSILTESAIRYAKVFNDKFAFKVNFSYLQATDWLSNTQTDQNPNTLGTANPAYPELNGTANNPAYDAWNRYGDENNNAVTITGVNYDGGNKTFILRRTGYWEKDLINPVVTNLKASGSLHYRFTPSTELSYSYRVGKMDGIFQRGNKIQLDNVVIQNHKLELKGSNFLVRSYVSIENTGDSYNLKPLADNLDLTNLSNRDWGNKFKAELQTQLDNGIALADAMRLARTIADQGRVEPGTQAFTDLKNTIIKTNNWDHANAGIVGAPATGGAWLRQSSRIYHSDAQWDLTNKVKFANVLVGADLRIYEVIPDGNNFVDFTRPVADRNKPLNPDAPIEDQSFGKNVFYTKYGLFTQVTKTFLDEKLKVSGSLRFDHNLDFTPKWNPRIAAVYTVAHQHNFRASFQNGFRFPSIFEALSFVNNGNVRRVGGLGFIAEGLGYLDNSYTLASVNAFNAAVNKDVTTGLAANDAALKNRQLLKTTNLSPTRPERINSFEIGYRSVILNNKLLVDFDAYTNVYDGFLGQVEVAVPENNAVQVGTDQAVIDMLAANRSKQTRYRVYTNAKNKYNNYGAALGLTYNFYQNFTLAGNINYNAITKNTQPDVFVTGFNTPNWFTNVSFGNREVVKNVGFNVVWRWQESFLWESPLANGTIPAYSNIDAQVTYRIPALKSSIKVGGTNLFNNRYVQYAAGPTIGALYYAAITVDGLFKKPEKTEP